MSYDFIAHAKRIENALILAGSEDIAKRLEDVRLGGATSGEILMGLRHECQLAQSERRIPQEIKTDMLALAHEVNETGI